MTAAVLVLGNEHDYAADSVISLLRARDIAVVRWNAETLSSDISSWQPGRKSPFRSIWLRDYLPAPPPKPTVDELDDYLVVRAQWRDWLATLEDENTRWVNSLWASRRAENKVIQLTVATRLGLQVPATIVTNDPNKAKVFTASQPHGAIVKTLASGYFAYTDRAFMFTTELTQDILSDVEAWATQPLIVQQRLPRARDIRVIVVDQFVVAAAVVTGGQDWRLEDPAPWHPIKLPPQVADRCRALVRGLGLIYGAIDLVDDGNTFWFLEINQAGEFQFLDRPLKLGVAEALAGTLAGL